MTRSHTKHMTEIIMRVLASALLQQLNFTALTIFSFFNLRLNSCCLSLGAEVYFFLHTEIRLVCKRTPLLSKQSKFKTLLTLKNIENVVPGLLVSLVSSSVVENSCLFSSQLPEDSLKLEEVHQEYLKHA